jgi:2-amino-4-ketopentanoate thiolase alpha subunit
MPLQDDFNSDKTASMNGSAVEKGRWARIHRLELGPSERAPGIPEDTAAVPFESWINGWLVEDAEIGERATLRTMTGRIVEGVLVEADPGYSHTFGSPPPELQRAGQQAWKRLFGKAGP